MSAPPVHVHLLQGIWKKRDKSREQRITDATHLTYVLVSPELQRVKKKMRRRRTTGSEQRWRQYILLDIAELCVCVSVCVLWILRTAK